MRLAQRLVRGEIEHRLDVSGTQGHAHPARQFAADRIHVAARGDDELVTVEAVRPGHVRHVRGLGIAGHLKFQRQRGLVHRHAGFQQLRPAIHPRRLGEIDFGDACLDAVIEHQRVRHHESDREPDADQDGPACEWPDTGDEPARAFEPGQGFCLPGNIGEV